MEDNSRYDAYMQYMRKLSARYHKEKLNKERERKIMLTSAQWGVVGVVAGIIAAICSLLSLLRLFDVI